MNPVGCGCIGRGGGIPPIIPPAPPKPVGWGCCSRQANEGAKHARGDEREQDDEADEERFGVSEPFAHSSGPERERTNLVALLWHKPRPLRLSQPKPSVPAFEVGEGVTRGVGGGADEPACNPFVGAA